MIEVIGFKRTLIFLTLLIVNVLIGGLLYFYILPESAKMERSLKILQRDVRSTQSELGKMQVEFDQLEEQRDRFDALKRGGFFSNQARGEVKDLLGGLRVDSNVISAVANVKPGIVEDNDEAAKVKYKILTSFVDVTLEALDDSDIYRYLELVYERFPGHISLDAITIRRSQDVNSVVLRAIASGASPALVTARIQLSWRTLIPEDQVIGDK